MKTLRLPTCDKTDKIKCLNLCFRSYFLVSGTRRNNMSVQRHTLLSDSKTKKNQKNFTSPYRGFELYDGKQTDCFCQRTIWPRTRLLLFSNSSSVHLKILPSEAKLIEISRPNVIIPTNIQPHIFVFIIRRELSFSKRRGLRWDRIIWVRLMKGNIKGASCVVWNQFFFWLVFFLVYVTCAGTNYTSYGSPRTFKKTKQKNQQLDRFWHVHLKLLIRCKYAKQVPMGFLWYANGKCKQRWRRWRFFCSLKKIKRKDEGKKILTFCWGKKTHKIRPLKGFCPTLVVLPENTSLINPPAKLVTAVHISKEACDMDLVLFAFRPRYNTQTGMTVILPPSFYRNSNLRASYLFDGM